MAHRKNTKKMYTKPTLTCTISIIKTLVLLASKNAVSRILIHTVSYTTLTHNSIYYQKSLERQQFKERRLLLLAQKVVCEAISHLRTKCFLMQIARLGCWGGFFRLFSFYLCMRRSISRTQRSTTMVVSACSTTTTLTALTNG